MEAAPLAFLLAALAWAVPFLVAYFIIRAAVRGAMLDHYRIVRRYETTGEWIPGIMSGAPKPFDSAGKKNVPLP